MRSWLDEHGFDAPCDALGAAGAARDPRGAARAPARRDPDRTAIARRQCRARARRATAELTPEGVKVELDVAANWRVPWMCATELVDLLEERGDRISGCANPDCILWFLDTTRPGTRRWCSMAACGNRDKAIRHGRVRGAVTANFDLTGITSVMVVSMTRLSPPAMSDSTSPTSTARSTSTPASSAGTCKGRGDGYAFLGDDARLVLTLWQQSSGIVRDRPARAAPPLLPGRQHRRGRASRDARPRARSEAPPRRHRPARRGPVQRRDLLRGPRRDPPGDLHRQRRRRPSAAPSAAPTCGFF